MNDHNSFSLQCFNYRLIIDFLKIKNNFGKKVSVIRNWPLRVQWSDQILSSIVQLSIIDWLSIFSKLIDNLVKNYLSYVIDLCEFNDHISFSIRSTYKIIDYWLIIDFLEKNHDIFGKSMWPFALRCEFNDDNSFASEWSIIVWLWNYSFTF